MHAVVLPCSRRSTGTGFACNTVHDVVKQCSSETQRSAASPGACWAQPDVSGLRACMQALENAFKNETVGLVTKADFIKKRTTLQERYGGCRLKQAVLRRVP